MCCPMIEPGPDGRCHTKRVDDYAKKHKELTDQEILKEYGVEQ